MLEQDLAERIFLIYSLLGLLIVLLIAIAFTIRSLYKLYRIKSVPVEEKITSSEVWGDE